MIESIEYQRARRKYAASAFFFHEKPFQRKKIFLSEFRCQCGFPTILKDRLYAFGHFINV